MKRSEPVRGDRARCVRSCLSRALPCFVAFVLSGCAGGAQAGGGGDVAVAAAKREAQLLEPFRAERTVIADRARIVMTGNFYDDMVLPALRPGVQDESRAVHADGGTEIVFTNRSPGSPLKLGLGRLTVLAVEEARIVLLGGRSEFRLDAEFEGKVPVSLLEGASRADFRSIRIQDGVLTRQP
jgi:hypothetical protein